MVNSISVPIRVNRDTRDELKAVGKKGETYDDVINRLFVCYGQIQTKGDNGILTEHEKGFLEGMIDGEGCITVGKINDNRYRNKISYVSAGMIDNTNEEVVKYCYKLVKKLGNCSMNGRKLPSGKTAYRLHIPPVTLRNLLNVIQLIAKSKQQELVMRVLQLAENNKHYPVWLNMKKEYNQKAIFVRDEIINEQKRIYEKIRELNK